MFERNNKGFSLIELLIVVAGARRLAISEDGVLRSDTTLTAPASEAAVQAIKPVGN